MLNFASDYTDGCVEEILEALSKSNHEHLTGYGSDTYCTRAKEKIREAVGCPDASVFFLSGGTQTNQIIIDSMLEGYEGVVSPVTGHVSCHEAGAIEYTGHKVINVPGHEGKMHADELKDLLSTFYADENHEHMPFPGLVYLTHPTEYGTLYTKKELQDIRAVAQEYHLPVYLDGARMAYAISSRNTDVTLKDIAELTDVFYIGGTKCGALLAEAIVFTKKNEPKHMLTRVKQHGGLLAKGWVMGIQFDVLFTDHLYEKIGAHAIDMAEKLKEILKEKGYPFFLESDTNQQFVIVDNTKCKELQEAGVVYGFWEKYDMEHTVIRFATSWATTPESLEQLKHVL